jgi:hypothetical protein
MAEKAGALGGARQKSLGCVQRIRCRNVPAWREGRRGGMLFEWLWHTGAPYISGRCAKPQSSCISTRWSKS